MLLYRNKLLGGIIDMGFFDLKATCAICNKEIGLNRFQIANKQWICGSCCRKCGFKGLIPMKKMTVEDITVAINIKQANGEVLQSFNATKKVGNFLEIDDKQMMWLVPEGLLGKKKNNKVYKYSDIVDFELLEDGETITKGGLGAAVVGGVLFQGVGAVVGSVTGKKKTKPICDSLKIKITVSNINNPVVYINFVTTPT